MAAASSTPFPNTYRRPKPPARSQSTQVKSTIKRSRIPGHSRASSTSSHSKSSHEAPRQPDLQHQHPAVTAAAAAAATAGAGTGTGTGTASDGDQQRERMPAKHQSSKYAHTSKQLPAVPRADSGDNNNSSSATGSYAHDFADSSSNYNSGIGVAISPGLPSPSPAFAPRSYTAPPTASAKQPPPQAQFGGPLTDAESRQHQHHHATMPPEAGTLNRINVPFASTDSVSSTSNLTTFSSRTMISSEPPSSADGNSALSQQRQHKPFVVRNGRTYLSDPTLPYPLPVDLTEIHRQSLRTLLLFQLFSGPVCSPTFANKPPARVL